MKKIALAALIAVASNGALAKVDLENAFLLSPGMTKQQVIETLGGRPKTTEFVGTMEEWHFCTIGFSQDRWAAVYFVDSKLYALKEYRAKVGGFNCEPGIKQGTYSEPDIVKEYRIKYR